MHVVMIARASKYRRIYIAKRFNRFPAGAIIRVNIFIGNNCSPTENVRSSNRGEKHPSATLAREIFSILRAGRFVSSSPNMIRDFRDAAINSNEFKRRAFSASRFNAARYLARFIVIKTENRPVVTKQREKPRWRDKRSENERFRGERRESRGGGSLWAIMNAHSFTRWPYNEPRYESLYLAIRARRESKYMYVHRRTKKP